MVYLNTMHMHMTYSVTHILYLLDIFVDHIWQNIITICLRSLKLHTVVSILMLYMCTSYMSIVIIPCSVTHLPMSSGTMAPFFLFMSIASTPFALEGSNCTQNAQFAVYIHMKYFVTVGCILNLAVIFVFCHLCPYTLCNYTIGCRCSIFHRKIYHSALHMNMNYVIMAYILNFSR